MATRSAITRRDRKRAPVPGRRPNVRRRSPKVVANADERYRALMENANDAICITADDGRILEANPAAEILHGRSAAELVGSCFLDFLAPEERDRIAQRFAEMLVRGSNHDSVVLLRRSGERVRAEVSASRVKIGGRFLTLAILRDVSEREAAAQALAASERRYRELFENASIGIYRSTRQGRFVHLNGAFAKELGYSTVEEVLSLNIPRDIYWDPAQREAILGSSGSPESMTRRELRLKRKDGSPLWVRLDSRIVEDETGQVFCEGFVQSIDERKRAERRLVAFSDLGRHLSSAQTVQEAARIIAACADDLWSAASCSLDLYAPDRDRITRVVTSEIPDGRRVEMPSADEDSVPNAQQRRVLRDGAVLISPETRSEETPPSGSGSILIAPVCHGGAVIGLITVESRSVHSYDERDLEMLQGLADFSGEALARIRASQELLKNERLLREAQRAGQIASWEWDIRTGSVVWSKELYAIAGIRLAEVPFTAEGILSLVHEDDRPAVSSAIGRAIRKARPFAFDCRIRRPDGSLRMMHARGEVLPTSSEKQGRVVGIAQDVTDRKNAEEELRRSRERLQMLSRRLIEAQEVERRHLARELHDEIGQALTAVKINLQAARQPRDQAELSARVTESIQIVERTMKQVRDISLALRPSLLDDLGLVPALRSCVDGQAQRAGFSAQFHAQPETIRLAPQLEIACYRVVQEALTNIARHAGARHVSVQIIAADGHVIVRVRDDGSGFDVEAARERAAAGASLGLLTMTERVRLLSGRLEIESTAERGTEVRAYLPLRTRTA